ncbi:hypothetical protein IMZ48_42765, partial [Candidatus Bathyarchaeota archaeon]|nr:hypothetical protein [Candidatus Bathyarchaeota archaeon]
MLFPWAEGGNLIDFWGKYAAPPGKDGLSNPSWRTPAWLWDQCRGLADALSFIHGYPGDKGRAAGPQRHADIQPRNILCSATPRGGSALSYTLQISDFEFSETFEAPESENRVRFPRVPALY